MRKVVEGSNGLCRIRFFFFLARDTALQRFWIFMVLRKSNFHRWSPIFYSHWPFTVRGRKMLLLFKRRPKTKREKWEKDRTKYRHKIFIRKENSFNMKWKADVLVWKIFPIFFPLYAVKCIPRQCALAVLRKLLSSWEDFRKMHNLIFLSSSYSRITVYLEDVENLKAFGI